MDNTLTTTGHDPDHPTQPDTVISLPPLLAAADAPPRLLETRGEWAEKFALERELPNLAFAEAVWQALIRLGEQLPEDRRPLPPRPWQGAALSLLLEHPYASLQGARQGAGKTFVAALVVACHLLLGASVTIAMPTYRQGSNILRRRVLLFMELLEDALELKRLRCNVHECAWDNGAELRMLSTSPGGRRGTQGWTSRVVVIDESHDLAYKDLAWFMPLVAMAMKQRRGRLLLLGVGAGPEAAPMAARGMPEYASLVLDDATIAALDRIRRAWLPAGHAELDKASWSDFFAAERGLWDEDYYRQFYMCQSPGSGQRKVFDRVPELIDTFEIDGLRPDLMAAYGAPSDDHRIHGTSGPSRVGEHGRASSARPGVAQRSPAYYLGVDVGKQRDQTVVAVLEQLGSVYNLIDCVRLPLGMAYTEQARELAALARAWGCPPGRFAVEVNGPGQALYDLLADPLNPAVPCATPVPMTVERKTQVLRRLASDMRRGVLGVAEIPLAGSKVSESGRYVGTGLALSAVGTQLAASATERFLTETGRHGAEDQRREPFRDSVLSLRNSYNFADSASAVQTADAASCVPTGSMFTGPSIRSHLASLNVYYTDDGIARTDHSDVLSALIVARCAMDEAALV